MVANLGRVALLDDKLDRLVSSLSKHCKNKLICPEQIECQQALIWGPVLLARYLWQQVNLSDIVQKHCKSNRQKFDVAETALVLVATRLCEPVILLTDMVVENRDWALQQRNRYVGRWAGCETSAQFLKSQIGLERFAVRRYRSMQGLIFLASLAMGFLSFVQSRCKDIRQRINDRLRYSRDPKSFWFYRLLIALRDGFSNRAKMDLLPWCRPPL